MPQKLTDHQKYVTSREGERILGVKRNVFFYYVESGQIEKREKTEKGPSLYKYADILKVKEKRESKKRKVSTQVDWMKPSDLPAILKLDYTVYQENIVGDIGLYVSWYRKNPRITLLSFESINRENVLSYISLVPLPEPVILSVLRGEKSELSISPDEVETYDRPGGYTLLAESAVTHPDHPEQLNTVLQAVLDYWCDQYPERYIEKVYALAVSDEGDVFVRKLYFSPLYALSDRAYVLDLRKPGASRLIKRFQECLKSKEA